MARLPGNDMAAGLIALAVTLAACAPSAMAEQTRRARRATPVSPTHTSPDVTGTIKSSKPAVPAPATATAPPPVAPAPVREDDEALPKPFDLPAAPRGRMRQCGESWQNIKMSGQAGDRTWREFASTCLTQTSASSAPPHPAGDATK